MVSANNVAHFFLSCSDEDIGDLISNLKLQKLIYYAQGLHLAVFDKPLFEEEVYAWQHGPVVPQIYQEYKSHGASGIPIPDNIDLSMFSQDQSDLLDEIYSVYGQFSAWKLRNMTHEEAPWKDCDINDVISKDAMKEFFITRIE